MAGKPETPGEGDRPSPRSGQPEHSGAPRAGRDEPRTRPFRATAEYRIFAALRRTRGRIDGALLVEGMTWCRDDERIGLTELRYYFDQQPFEQDIFSHMFRAIAAANVAAGEASEGDPAAVRYAVDAAIAGQLDVIVPNLQQADRKRFAAMLPDALRHPRFGPAWERVRENSAGWSPFMAVPADAHVAIVLAGLGIAAAPLLKSTPVSLAPPTDDVDRLAVMFGDGPDLLVGFEPAAQEHYFLLSSSAHSLRRCLKHNPAFRALRRTFGKQLRQAAAGPSGPAGVLGAYPRQPGQRLSSLGHRDGDEGDLTTLFIGGWMENGVACDEGGPTIQPIPMRMVEYFMRHGIYPMMTLMRRTHIAVPGLAGANDA